jgi:hypothetical protein
VAKRIFISQLAPFFAAKIGGVNLILLLFIILRHIAIGFDGIIPKPPKIASSSLTVGWPLPGWS